MKSFLSMAANRVVDSYAINTCGIPGATLMQNAGDQFIQQLEIHKMIEKQGLVLVLAGKGNNGGDGYVIASGLAQRGYQVTVIQTIEESNIQGDALHHYRLLDHATINVELWDNTQEQQHWIHEADLIVDALLGTGIQGEMRSPYSDIIDQCNQSKATIVSVDVPSGVTGDLGQILEPCIRADYTISMGYGKQGCLFEPARSHCGEITIVDIGFPDDSLSHIKDVPLEEYIESDYPPSNFTRSVDSHKYSVGKVYIIAGAKGYTGAALLASTAALRSGAGLVKLAIPKSLGGIAETTSLETIVEYMPETPGQSLSLEAYPAILETCKWADVVAIGPGIGREDETLELIRRLIENIDRPLVIDADALYAIRGLDLQVLKQRTAPTIITPHIGEFKKLAPSQDEEAIPSWKDARDLAKEYGAYVLLKGAPSLIASPKGKVVVNRSGYAGMATAGSGDVLTGVLASLWSQWGSNPDVLNFAMHIHGKAAELNRAEKGVLGLIASDIVNSLPRALKEYGDIPA